MKQFLKFLTKLKSFWEFYQNYEYDGETVEFIIDNYLDVLHDRTKLMSKPTYNAGEVIKQIDEWYYEEYEPFKIWQTGNKFANRIELSVEYSDLVNSDKLEDVVIEKIRKEISIHDKKELMKTHTAEQVAEEFIKTYNGDSINQIVVNVGGLPKIYPIKEIEDIVMAYEEIKICQEQNKQCKTILPAEHLKVLTLNQTVSELQSEVEKYRKAFEDAKKERDCQIVEYKNRVEEDKLELERAKNTINNIDDILEKLFGVRHDTVDKPDEFEKILADRAKGNLTDILPTEPIKVAETLIMASGECEPMVFGNEAFKDTYRIFEVSELRQIAQYLLVYCNHNGEAEE